MKAQELFDRALRTGENTIEKLTRALDLRNESRRQVLEMIADLETVTRALYSELNERDGR